MRIGIDCRLSGLQHAGIGRYTQELILQLLKIQTTHTWILFFNSQNQAKNVLTNNFNSTNVEVIIAPIKHYSVAEQLTLPILFYKARLDLLHVPHFNAPILYFKSLVITIHDLLWHEHRGSSVTTLSSWRYWLKYTLYRVIASVNIWKAKKIIIPAQTIKKIVTAYYPWAEKKLTVTYEGTALPQTPGELPKKLKSKQFLLYVGSLYPHKNINVVLQTLQLDPLLQLVLVGSRNVFLQQTLDKAQEFKVEKQIQYLGRVNDHELAALYKHAQALLQPSLSEGFGLTGIEAMQYGCTVIASDIPIFHEIYGEAAIFFDPHSHQSCKRAIDSLTLKVKTELQKKSKKQLQKFSWKRMVKETFEVYKTIAPNLADDSNH